MSQFDFRNIDTSKLMELPKTPEQIQEEAPQKDFTESILDAGILSYGSPDSLRQGLSPEMQQAFHDVDVDYGYVPRDRGNAFVEPIRQFGEQAYQAIADSARGTAKTLEMLGGEQNGVVSNAVQEHLNRNQWLSGPQYKNAVDKVFSISGSALGSTAPAIALSYIPYVGPALSVAQTFARTYGDNVQRNMNTGMNDAGAFGLALAESSIDTAIEHMPWGILGHAKGAARVSRLQKMLKAAKGNPAQANRIAKDIVRTIERTYGKGSKSLLKRVGTSILTEGLGEAGEEFLQGANNTIFRKLSGEKDAEFNMSELVDEAVAGFIGGMFLGAGQHAIHGAKTGIRKWASPKTMIDLYRNYGNDIYKKTGSSLREQATTEGVKFADIDTDDTIREKMCDNWLNNHDVTQYQYTSVQNNMHPSHSTVSVTPDANAKPNVVPTNAPADATANVSANVAQPKSGDVNVNPNASPDTAVTQQPVAANGQPKDVVKSSTKLNEGKLIGTQEITTGGKTQVVYTYDVSDVNKSVKVDNDLKTYGLVKSDIEKMSVDDLIKFSNDIVDAYNNGNVTKATVEYILAAAKGATHNAANAVSATNDVNAPAQVSATNATGTYSDPNAVVQPQQVSADVDNGQSAVVNAPAQNDTGLAYTPNNAAPVNVGAAGAMTPDTNTVSVAPGLRYTADDKIHTVEQGDANAPDIATQRAAVADYKANPDKYRGKIRVLTNEELQARYGNDSEYIKYATEIAKLLGAKRVQYAEYPPELNTIAGEHINGENAFTINLNNTTLKEPSALVHTIVHEASHVFSNVDKEKFDTIKNFIKTKIADKQKYQKELEKYITQRGGNLESDKAENEFVCDLIGQMFRTKRFIDAVQTKANTEEKSAIRKLFEYILKVFKDVVDKLDTRIGRAGVGNKYAVFSENDIQAIEDSIAEIISAVDVSFDLGEKSAESQTNNVAETQDGGLVKATDSTDGNTADDTKPQKSDAVEAKQEPVQEPEQQQNEEPKAEEKPKRTTEELYKILGDVNSSDRELNAAFDELPVGKHTIKGYEFKKDSDGFFTDPNTMIGMSANMLPKLIAKYAENGIVKQGKKETISINGKDFKARKIDFKKDSAFYSVQITNKEFLLSMEKSEWENLVGMHGASSDEVFLNECEKGGITFYPNREYLVVNIGRPNGWSLVNDRYTLFIKKLQGLKANTENKPETKPETKPEDKSGGLKTADELKINNVGKYWEGGKHKRFYFSTDCIEKVCETRMSRRDERDVKIFINSENGAFDCNDNYYNKGEDQFRYLAYNHPEYKKHGGVVPDEYKYMVEDKQQSAKQEQKPKQTEEKPKNTQTPITQNNAETEEPKAKPEQAKAEQSTVQAQAPSPFDVLRNAKPRPRKQTAQNNASAEVKPEEPKAAVTTQAQQQSAEQQAPKPQTVSAEIKQGDGSTLEVYTGAEAESKFNDIDFSIVENYKDGEPEGNDYFDELKVGFGKSDDKLYFAFIDNTEDGNGKIVAAVPGVLNAERNGFVKTADDVIKFVADQSSDFQQYFDGFGFNNKIRDAFNKQQERFTKPETAPQSDAIPEPVPQNTAPVELTETNIKNAVSAAIETASNSAKQDTESITADTNVKRENGGLTNRNYIVDGEHLNHLLNEQKPKEAIANNIKAIKLLKELQSKDVAPKDLTKEQRETLAGYVGWGGLTADSLLSEKNELQNVLTPSEYAEILRSKDTAYYTSPDEIKLMWDIATQAGFNGGKVGEFGAGTGNFLGMVPSAIRNKTQFTAIERDDISAGILKYLYPDANVIHKDMALVGIPNNSLDMVIGNVPFAKNVYKNLGGINMPLHDYAIAKALKAVKPGGIVVVMTSHETMDNPANLNTFSRFAKLVGAYRLDSDTFRNTGIVTDILMFCKPMSPTSLTLKDGALDKDTNKTVTMKFDEEDSIRPIKINAYFENGAHTRGFPEVVTGRFGGTLRVNRKDVTQEEILENFKGGKFNRISETADATYYSVAKVINGYIKPNQLFFGKDGKIMQNNNGEAVELKNLKPNQEIVAKSFIELSDAFRDFTQKMKAIPIEDKARAKETIAELNTAYEKFATSYISKRLQEDSPLTVYEIRRNSEYSFIRKDPNLVKLATLEDITTEPDGKKNLIIVNKSKLLKERVFTEDGTPKSFNTKREAIDYAVAVSGSLNDGALKYLETMYDKDKETLLKELMEEKEIFFDPIEQKLVSASQYLSGNILNKIDSLEKVEDPQFKPIAESNIRELTKVIPTRKTIEDINAFICSSYVPKNVVLDFLNSEVFVYGLDRRDLVIEKTAYGERRRFANEHSSFSSENLRDAYKALWKPNPKNEDDCSASSMLKIINSALENHPHKASRGKDMSAEQLQSRTSRNDAIINRLREDFIKYLNNPDNIGDAKQVEDLYNRQYNSMVDVSVASVKYKYFPNASTQYELRDYQKNAVSKALTLGNMLFNHCVGSGKTFTMITTAMELKRTGRAKRPMIVVQNSTLDQFASSAQKLYPDKKIIAYNSSYESSAEFWAIVNSDDWDLVIIPQSRFNELDLSYEELVTTVEKQISEIEKRLFEQGIDVAAVRKNIRHSKRENEMLDKSGHPSEQQENLLKNIRFYERFITKALNQRESKGYKNTVFFDETGVDALFLDESHYYKKIPVISSLSSAVKGIDTADDAIMGLRAFLNMEYVRNHNNGLNTFTATGTPVTNTCVELYNAIRMVNPRALVDFGCPDFDTFQRNFANITNDLGQNNVGEWKYEMRMRTFTNIQALHRLLASSTDYVSKDMVDNTLKDESVVAVRVEHKIPISGSMQVLMSMLHDLSITYTTGKYHSDPKLSWVPVTIYTIGKSMTINPKCAYQGQDIEIKDTDSDYVRRIKELVREIFFNSEKAYECSKMRYMVDEVVKSYRKNNEERNLLLDREHSLKLMEEVDELQREYNKAEERASSYSKLNRQHIGAMSKITAKKVTKDKTRSVKLMNARKPDAAKLARKYAEAKRIELMRKKRMLDRIPNCQAIFVDRTKNEYFPDKYVIADEIIEHLVQQGIPRDEIAVVPEKREDRKKVFDECLEGKIRVIIGSTSTMGTGVNIQTFLSDMHMLDLPYMPGELIQRIGRGERQGNLFRRPKVHYYAIDGTSDSMMMNLIYKKQVMIDSVMNYNDSKASVVCLDDNINLEDFATETSNSQDRKEFMRQQARLNEISSEAGLINDKREQGIAWLNRLENDKHTYTFRLKNKTFIDDLYANRLGNYSVDNKSRQISLKTEDGEWHPVKKAPMTKDKDGKKIVNKEATSKEPDTIFYDGTVGDFNAQIGAFVGKTNAGGKRAYVKINNQTFSINQDGYLAQVTGRNLRTNDSRSLIMEMLQEDGQNEKDVKYFNEICGLAQDTFSKLLSAIEDTGNLFAPEKIKKYENFINREYGKEKQQAEALRNTKLDDKVAKERDELQASVVVLGQKLVDAANHLNSPEVPALSDKFSASELNFNTFYFGLGFDLVAKRAEDKRNEKNQQDAIKSNNRAAAEQMIADNESSYSILEGDDDSVYWGDTNYQIVDTDDILRITIDGNLNPTPDNDPDTTPDDDGGNNSNFSVLEDDDIIGGLYGERNELTGKEIKDRLERELASGKYVKVYRTMQINEDGDLVPPMAVKKYDAIPVTVGSWVKSDPKPELARPKANGKGYDYALGGSTQWASYNPYLHSSTRVLNDQFGGAYYKPQFVTVEMLVPKSEVDSNIRLEKATDPTGFKDWNAGVVYGKIADKDESGNKKPRQVLLSRFGKIARVLSYDETAEMINNEIGSYSEPLPAKVFHPAVKNILESKYGRKFVPLTDKELAKQKKESDAVQNGIEKFNSKHGLNRSQLPVSDFLTIEQEQQMEQDRKAAEPVYGKAYAFYKTALNAPAELLQNVGFSNNLINEKKDISGISVMYKDPMHLFEKVGAAKRIFNAGQEMLDDKIRFENYIYNVSDDGYTSDLKTIADLAKKDKKAYKAFSEYLVKQDRDAAGKIVREDDGRFLVFDDNKAFEKYLQNKENGEPNDNDIKGFYGDFDTEEDAWKVVFDLERTDLESQGVAKKIADAVYAYRTIMRRSFLAQRAHTFKEFREMNGLDENDNNLYVKIPKSALPENESTNSADEEELVEVNLWDIYREMGQRSAYYFPRIRNGKYILQATGKDGRHIREAFTNRLARSLRVAQLKKEGATDFTTSTSDRSAENIFSDINLTSLADIVGAVTDKIDEKSSETNMRVEDWKNKKSGKVDRQLVITLDEETANQNRALRKLLKEMGAGYYGDEDHAKAWRIKYDKVTPENYNRLANLLDAMETVANTKSTLLKNFLNVSLAEIIKQNTAHSSKLRRGDEVGSEVILGYIEDPLTAMTQLVASTCASNARTIMAKRMYNAYNGTDIDFQIFMDKAMKKLNLSPEMIALDVDAFMKCRKEASKLYMEEVKKRRIDRKQQPVIAGQLNKYIKDMTRNTTEIETILGIMKSVAAVKYLSRISSAVANMVGGITTIPAVINSRTGVGIGKNLKNLMLGATQYYRYFLHYYAHKGSPLSAKDTYIFSTIRKMNWDGSQQKDEMLESTKKLLGKAVNKASGVAMATFSFVERLNRAGAIYSAFEALLDKTGTKYDEMTDSQRFEMLKKAKQISDYANGVYNKGNRLMWTRGGSALNALTEQVMLFRTFDINYLNNWIYALHHAQFKPLLYMSAINMLAGGVEASLVWSVLTALVSALGLGGDNDRGEDKHQKLYNALADNGFGATSRFLQYGIAGLANTNIQGSLANDLTDIPTSLTDGALFSTIKDLTFGKDLQARDLASADKIWRSSLAHDVVNGEYGRAAQRLLPQAIAQPVVAIERRHKGLRNRYGNKLKGVDGKQITPDWKDTLTQLLTFNPAGTSEKLKRLYNEKAVLDAYAKRKKDIYQDFREWNDSEGKDKEKLRKIMLDIKEFNDEVNNSKYKEKLTPITDKGLKSAISSKSMKR